MSVNFGGNNNIHSKLTAQSKQANSSTNKQQKIDNIFESTPGSKKSVENHTPGRGKRYSREELIAYLGDGFTAPDSWNEQYTYSNDFERYSSSATFNKKSGQWDINGKKGAFDKYGNFVEGAKLVKGQYQAPRK